MKENLYSDVNLLYSRLKHKPPILMLDKIIEIVEGVKCLGLIDLNMNKWFFACHYPGNPVMTASLLIEAMSQAATLLISHWCEDEEFPLLYQVSRANFKAEAKPGEMLFVKAELVSFSRVVAIVSCDCTSNAVRVCKAKISLVIRSKFCKLHNN